MNSFNDGGYRSQRGAGSGSRRGTVKWFNPTKGFGFVTLDDGTDAFCHASALSSLSDSNLPPGATVQCDVSQGQRGIQITTVHSVDLSTAEAPAPRGGFGGGGGGGYGGDRGGFRPSRPRHDGPSGPMGDGHVKFFNEQKGFGFVVPASGGTDVYVHASALRRCGIPTLAPEQKVRFSTRQGMKGVEVDRIELI